MVGRGKISPPAGHEQESWQTPSAAGTVLWSGQDPRWGDVEPEHGREAGGNQPGDIIEPLDPISPEAYPSLDLSVPVVRKAICIGFLLVATQS